MFAVRLHIFSKLIFALIHMKKVFISRYLSEDSIFCKMLAASEFEVHGETLLTFSMVPVEMLPQAAWLFFYSKNGVRFFFQQIPLNRIDSVKLAAIGPGTAAFLESVARPPDFTGDGEPGSTAAAFLKLAVNQRVLFPQAKESRQSIQKLLSPYLTPLDLVVYENLPRQDVQLPVCDVLVFTSPLNARAFFAEQRWNKNQKVVAIGKTTEKALQELGIDRISVAEEPTEEALAVAVLKS